MSVVLADYGAGNLRSISSALARAGAEAVVTRDSALVREAQLAIGAGVGNLASAVRSLEESGLAEALRERAARSRPLLGICVGMQLLFEESEEGGRGWRASARRPCRWTRRGRSRPSTSSAGPTRR